MLEVEVKFAVGDFAPIESAIRKLGAVIQAPRRDADHYFNAPDRDFAQTDEAVRVRSIGDKNFVTYKGPKIDRETKTRLEIEVPLADGEEAAADFRRLMTHLRYRPVAVVQKTRRFAEFTRGEFEMQLTLDEVDGVGQYAELEVVAKEERADAAKAAVLAVAAELGLGPSERRSYLQLLLEKQGKHDPAGHAHDPDHPAGHRRGGRPEIDCRPCADDGSAARRPCQSDPPGAATMRFCRRQHLRQSDAVRADGGFFPLPADITCGPRYLRA